MKKIFFLLFLLPIISQSQQNLTVNDIFIKRGLFPPAKDTTTNPRRLGELRFDTAEKKFYYCINLTAGTKRWEVITSSSSGGIDDVLAALQQFTASREIDMNGYDFYITSSAPNSTFSVGLENGSIGFNAFKPDISSSSFDVTPDTVYIYANKGNIKLDSVRRALNMSDKLVAVWDSTHKLLEFIHPDSLGTGSTPTLQQVLATQSNNPIVTATTDIRPDADTRNLYFGNAQKWGEIKLFSKDTTRFVSDIVLIDTSDFMIRGNNIENLFRVRADLDKIGLGTDDPYSFISNTNVQITDGSNGVSSDGIQFSMSNGGYMVGFENTSSGGTAYGLLIRSNGAERILNVINNSNVSILRADKDSLISNLTIPADDSTNKIPTTKWVKQEIASGGGGGGSGVVDTTGTPVANGIAVFTDSDKITTYEYFKLIPGLYPTVESGAAGYNTPTYRYRDAAGTYAYITYDGGVNAYGSDTYMSFSWINKLVGGEQMLRVYDAGSANFLAEFNKTQALFTKLKIGIEEGSININNVLNPNGNIHSLDGASNVHGITVHAYNYGNTASANSVNSIIEMGNNNSSATQDHGVSFQHRFTKRGLSTLNHMYGAAFLQDSAIGGVTHVRNPLRIWDMYVSDSAVVGNQIIIIGDKLEANVTGRNYYWVLDSGHVAQLNGVQFIGDTTNKLDANKIIQFSSTSTPTSPISGIAALYNKSGELYAYDEDGNEYNLTAAVGLQGLQDVLDISAEITKNDTINLKRHNLTLDSVGHLYAFTRGATYNSIMQLDDNGFYTYSNVTGTGRYFKMETQSLEEGVLLESIDEDFNRSSSINVKIDEIYLRASYGNYLMDSVKHSNSVSNKMMVWDSLTNEVAAIPIPTGGGSTDLSIGTRTATDLPLLSSSGADVSLPLATPTLAGIMSAADKAKLDSNFYIKIAKRTGFDSLAWWIGDSAVGIKAIAFAMNNFSINTTKTDSTLFVDIISQMSITADADGFKLVGDANTPGNSKYYGTNGSGTKGYYDLPSGGSISDGDKGDITVSASGATWTIDNDVVTFAKMQEIGTNKVIGRTTAGTGNPEEVDAAIINLTSVADGDHLEYSSGEWINKVKMSLPKLDIENGTTDTTTVDDELPFFENTGNTNKKATIEDVLRKYVREYRRAYAYDYFNEFINTVTTTSPGSEVMATNNGSGAATSTTATDATTRVGVVRTTTGTTATGRSYVNGAGSSVRLGGGKWVYETYVNPITLSTSGERYQQLFGFFDTYTAANQVDGCYFLYDEGGVSTGSAASANWQLVTVSNSTRTFTTTSTAVTAATWVKLRIEVNADASRVDFFIDGTNVGNHTANIPTGSGRETGFGWGMIKSVGTTARTLDIDYLMVQNEYTTAK